MITGVDVSKLIRYSVLMTTGYRTVAKVVKVETMVKGRKTLAMLRTPDMIFHQRLVDEKDDHDVRLWCRECDRVMLEKNLKWAR